MAQKQRDIAGDYYKKAIQFGALTVRERIRRLIFPIYNLIKNK